MQPYKKEALKKAQYPAEESQIESVGHTAVLAHSGTIFDPLLYGATQSALDVR